jgi:hypothetical protein
MKGNFLKISLMVTANKLKIMEKFMKVDQCGFIINQVTLLMIFIMDGGF